MFGGTYGLPALGDPETVKVEFKAEVDTQDHIKLARHVAALVNAFGGTIFVGCCHDRRGGQLVAYKPMNDNEAQLVISAFELAVRDHCSPRPVVTYTHHEMAGKSSP